MAQRTCESVPKVLLWRLQIETTSEKSMFASKSVRKLRYVQKSTWKWRSRLEPGFWFSFCFFLLALATPVTCFGNPCNHHFSSERCIWSLEENDAHQWWQILYYCDYQIVGPAWCPRKLMSSLELQWALPHGSRRNESSCLGFGSGSLTL